MINHYSFEKGGICYVKIFKNWGGTKLTSRILCIAIALTIVFTSLGIGYTQRASAVGTSSYASFSVSSITRSSVTVKVKVKSKSVRSVLVSANQGRSTCTYKSKTISKPGTYTFKLTGLRKGSKYKLYSDVIVGKSKHYSWSKQIKTKK